MEEYMKTLRIELETELRKNILPYWIHTEDQVYSGFIGRIDGKENYYPEADKGGVLNARILWTFSSAYRLTGDKSYLETATRAKNYLLTYFYDKENGGIYWSVAANGTPVDTKKQIYALGFAIYGLSEYYRATEDEESLEYAKALFQSIEKYSFDKNKNGYFEAFDRKWGVLGDVRLSDKDDNDCKTMNTHLHILEPYTNLWRVWKSPELKKQLANLITLFLDKILDEKTGHLKLFFDEDWNIHHNMVSYGHDIEASWLLYEAAHELGDVELIKRVDAQYLRIADAASEGLNDEGGMIYEFDKDSGHKDEDCHWWVQAETVVGYYNAYQHSKNIEYLNKALKTWKYIRTYIIDKQNGEWHWSFRHNGTINREDDKVGPWKCPYHNGRMCMELMELMERIGN